MREKRKRKEEKRRHGIPSFLCDIKSGEGEKKKEYHM